MGKKPYKVLVVVDMQNDFITGPLGTDDCRNAVAGCVDLCRNGGFDRVLFTQDTHEKPLYEFTLEGRRLPVEHCVNGSEGWQIIPELLPFTDSSRASCCQKSTFGYCHIATRLGEMLGDAVAADEEAGGEEVEIHFCGVCTSICVISNIALARTFFPNNRIVLHTKATGDVTEEARQAAFTVAKSIMCDLED